MWPRGRTRVCDDRILSCILQINPNTRSPIPLISAISSRRKNGCLQVGEDLVVDDASAELNPDDLDVCSLAVAVLSVDS